MTKIIANHRMIAENMFLLKQSFGFPKDIYIDRLRRYCEVTRKDIDILNTYFDELQKRHRQKSRMGADKRFKNG